MPDTYNILPGASLPYDADGQSAEHKHQHLKSFTSYNFLTRNPIGALGSAAIDAHLWKTTPSSPIRFKDGKRYIEKHGLLDLVSSCESRWEGWKAKNLGITPISVEPDLYPDKSIRDQLIARGAMLSQNPSPKAAIPDFPVYTTWGQILKEHPLYHSHEDMHLGPLPLVGEDPINIKSLKARSTPGNPAKITMFEYAGLSTREALAHFHSEIDAVIASGKTLEEAADGEHGNRSMRFLRTFLMNCGRPDSGSEVALAANIQFHSVLLLRSRELFKEELAKLGGPTVPSYLPAASTPTDLKKQTAALKHIDLPAAPVSVNDLQAKLLELGPNHPQVTKFFDTYPMSAQLKESLQNMLKSQARYEQEAVDKNAKLKKINENRTNADGDEKKAVELARENKNMDLWDRRIGLMSKYGPKSCLADVAALSTAKILLTKGIDVDEKELKTEIAQALSPALPKNDTSGVVAHTGAGAEASLEQANKHFKESPEARGDITVVRSSMVVAEYYLKKLKTEEDAKFSSEGLQKVMTDAALGIVDLKEHSNSTFSIASATLGELKGKNGLGSSNPTQRARAQLQVAENAVLKNALRLKLNESKIDIAKKGEFLVAFTRLIDKDGFNEVLVKKCMNEAKITEKEVSSSSLHQTGQLALLVTEGVNAKLNADVGIKDRVAEEIKKLEIPNGTAKVIADRLDEIKVAELKDYETAIKIFEKEITRTNNVITAICVTPTEDFLDDAKKMEDFKKDQAGQENFKTATLAIANHYKEHGGINDKEVIKILKTHLKNPAWLPAEDSEQGFSLLAEILLTRVSTAANESNALPPASENDPRIESPSKSRISQSITNIVSTYENSANFATAEAAAAITRKAGGNENEVRTVVTQQLMAPRTTKTKTAAAAVKKTGKATDFVLSMALTTLVTKDDPEANSALGQVHSDNRPPLKKATAGAIGEGINTLAKKAGIPDDSTKAIREELTGKYLRDKEWLKNLAQGKEENGEIKDLEIPTLYRLMNQRTSRVARIISAARDEDSLGCDITPVDLRKDIEKNLITSYLKDGQMNNEIARTIINETIAKHNRDTSSNINASIECKNFEVGSGMAKAALSPEQGDQCRAAYYSLRNELNAEVRKTIILTTGVQALENVEKKHGQTQPNQPQPPANYKEVAVAIVPAAMTNENLTQEQAVQLSEKVTDDYVSNKGNLDELNLARIKIHLAAVNPDLPESEKTKTAKYVLKAIHSAAKLEKDSTKSVASGTTVAAEIFPLFNRPNEAAAAAELITQVQGGSSQDISRAGAYAQDMAKTTYNLTPFSSVAAGAIAVYHASSIPDHKRVSDITVKAEEGIDLNKDVDAKKVVEHLSTSLRLDSKPKVFLVGTYIAATGDRLGVSDDEIKTAIGAGTFPTVWQHGKEVLTNVVRASLDFERARECQEIVTHLANTTGYAALRSNNFRLTNDAVREAGDRGNRVWVRPYPALQQATKQVYDWAFLHYTGDLPESKQTAEKRYREIAAHVAASRAAAQFAKERMEDPAASQTQLSEAAKLVQGYSKQAVESTEEFQRLVKENNPGADLSGRNFNNSPRLARSKVEALSQAAWMGRLVNIGLEAANALKADIKDTPEQKLQKQAAKAVRAITEAQGITDLAELDKVEKEALAIIKDSTPEEAGAMVAKKLKATPEVAHAYAATVTDILFDHTDANKRIADATKAAAIGEDGALPPAPDQDSELQKVENQKRRNNQIAFENEKAAMLGKEIEALPKDEVTRVANEEVGNDKVIEINSIKLVLPAYGHDPRDKEAKTLDQIPEFKEIFDELKVLGPHVNGATLREAVAAMNSTLPAFQKLEVQRLGKRATVNLTGLNHGQIKKLLKLWVNCANARQDRQAGAKKQDARQPVAANTPTMRVRSS
ncbi:MAG: hypothetical protein JSR33_02540 [Proteobacteria bacterium]|nr:hypothetical protein [Pseudomonadota bacterium]